MKRKPTSIIQLKVRMTEALRARLEGEAKREGTSINGQIVERLKQSFKLDDMLKARLITTESD